ncbi:MAG: anthranilate synthase component I family protein [Flavisolibacter sp.]|nr:anthranilate synthase component I family protein [Flavisolibacter sp.]
MLNWAQQFSIFCFLDNQDYSIAPHRYECLLAAGVTDFINVDTSASLKDLDAFIDRSSWIFGHLSYDIKNLLYPFSATKENRVGFPLYYFFEPQFLCILNHNKLTIKAENANAVFAAIMQQPEFYNEPVIPVSIRQRLSQNGYIECVEQLQQHILRGDCYEINFCQEFFAEDAVINPLSVFNQLMQESPNPFSAFYKWHDSYLICASPERFLYKEGSHLISQPIKGTAKRNRNNRHLDEQTKRELAASTKERSENVMVVDLVRNDLSKVCKEASVHVSELFGIYSFPQVHQMISTIRGEIKEGVTFSELIAALFPMGSMTGAPKHNVLQLIDQYESFSRGLFSGSVGYIQPNGDFDFNVVIRSILYNSEERYLSYLVGSGITFYSDAEKEWEECLLKAAAIKKVLTV